MTVKDHQFVIHEYYCSLTEGTCYTEGKCSECEEPEQWEDLKKDA